MSGQFGFLGFRVSNSDASADFLADMLRTRQPFFFVRIGDGAVECILRQKGHTCDDEAYSPVLAMNMRDSIKRLQAAGPAVCWGDWRTAVAGSAPKLVSDWELLVEVDRRCLLDYEALLLMRRSDALRRFYYTVKCDPRRKLYVGPAHHAGAGNLLGADFLPLPMGGVFEHAAIIQVYLETFRPEVILFGAGMGGLIPIVRYWFERYAGSEAPTCIHLGSALDPLFGRPTRSRQLPQAAAREFLKELL